MSSYTEKAYFFDPDIECPEDGLIAEATYHLKTLYLITASDLKTTLLPATIFALTVTLSGPLLATNPSTPFNPATFFPSIFKSIIWTYLNLLLFNLSNQRLPNSIIEDSINKPWRAIPSGRLSPTSARHLLLILIPIVLISTLYLGARNETLALIVLTYLYNDLGAADEHFIIRHFTNALGFVSFGAGAAQVACSDGGVLNATAFHWLAFIAAVITFTIQFQDMEDQEGDRERERRTLPLVLGDIWTRRLNTIVIILFSTLAPAFWGLSVVGFIVPGGLGAAISGRSLWYRTLKDDKKTFKLWCLWLMTLYLLPLLAEENGGLFGCR